MALQEIPGDLSGITGTVETIQIVAAEPGYTVTITSVLYGTNGAGPIPIKLNGGNSSFDLTILSGTNLLQVVLFSPDTADGSAMAKQTSGGTSTVLEDDIEFVNGVAVWSPEIAGS